MKWPVASLKGILKEIIPVEPLGPANDGTSFRLVQQYHRKIHLFRERDGMFELLLVLSEDDRRFEDRMLVAIGDTIEAG